MVYSICAVSGRCPEPLAAARGMDSEGSEGGMAGGGAGSLPGWRGDVAETSDLLGEGYVARGGQVFEIRG